ANSSMSYAGSVTNSPSSLVMRISVGTAEWLTPARSRPQYPPGVSGKSRGRVVHACLGVSRHGPPRRTPRATPTGALALSTRVHACPRHADGSARFLAKRGLECVG